MKSWHVAVASLILGVAAGLGITWFEFSGVSELFAAARDSGGGQTISATKGARAKVEGGTEHFFEPMIVGATKSHEFVVTNVGQQPLKLEVQGKPSCQCTQFDVPKEPIPPGESAKVFLEWKPKEFNADFHQIADVRTNDVDTPSIRFVIRGRVLQFARAVPGEITLNGISTHEERSTQVRVFGYTDEEVKIASHEFGDPQSAEHFDAHWEPLLGPDLAAEKFAKSGVLLTITAKPGLPLGTISQTIRLALEGPENRRLEIPIKGSVTSDISILGGENFDKEKNVLKLGLVKGAQGSKTVMRVMFKGPHRSDAPLKILAVEPAEALKVTLSEPNNQEKYVIYLLTIEVPPGSPPVNRIASPQNKPGRIRIETPLPAFKELDLQVSFAVEE